MMKTISYALPVAIIISLLAPGLTADPARAADEAARYVGSVACRDCHERYYTSFMTYAKKRKSFESIERMKSTLTEDEIRECYACHTTGYGQPGGFVSPEETPQLMNAGCEVCHGPGERHVQSGGRGQIIGKLSEKDCLRCHIPERVTSFGLKPLIHGGAH